MKSKGIILPKTAERFRFRICSKLPRIISRICFLSSLGSSEVSADKSHLYGNIRFFADLFFFFLGGGGGLGVEQKRIGGKSSDSPIVCCQNKNGDDVVSLIEEDVRSPIHHDSLVFSFLLWVFFPAEMCIMSNQSSQQ